MSQQQMFFDDPGHQQQMNNDLREQQQFSGSQQEYYHQPMVGDKIIPRRRRSKPSSLFWLILTGIVILLFLAGLGTSNMALRSNMQILMKPMMQGNSVTTPFKLAGKPKLVIINNSGSISVHSGSNSLVTVQATSLNDFRGNAIADQVNYARSSDGNTITVTTNKPPNTPNTNPSTVVNLDITVPIDADLNLQTNQGDIDVAGINGQVVLQSTSGAITVEQSTLSNNSKLITKDGSINFVGDIQAGGTYLFLSNSGSIDVTLPVHTAFHLAASTVLGTIDSNLPLPVIQQNGGFSVDQTYNDVPGSTVAEVTIKTGSGSITLNSR